jgi:hypothetical protein
MMSVRVPLITILLLVAMAASKTAAGEGRLRLRGAQQVGSVTLTYYARHGLVQRS